MMLWEPEQPMNGALENPLGLTGKAYLDWMLGTPEQNKLREERRHAIIRRLGRRNKRRYPVRHDLNKNRYHANYDDYRYFIEWYDEETWARALTYGQFVQAFEDMTSNWPESEVVEFATIEREALRRYILKREGMVW